MHIIQRILLLGIFIGILLIIIGFARGYRIDIQKGKITSTGILAVSSSPKAAKIYVNGALRGVTDTNITLPFGKYSVEIKKDGYTSWKREVVLKGELVVAVDATLFPLNASLTPLTTIGISAIVPIDKTDKALLFVQNGDEEKDGIYLFDQAKRAFSLFPPIKILAYKKQFPEQIDFSAPTVQFSPDYKEGICTLKNGEDSASYLISFENENPQLFEVTTSKDSLLAVWEQERLKETTKLLEVFPPGFAKIASDSFHLVSIAPDKTKILYEAKKEIKLPLLIKPPLNGTNQQQEQRDLLEGHIYIYDRKEDKNYEVVLSQEIESKRKEGESVVQWYQTSRHVVVRDDTNIYIEEYDGTNKQIIYSGPREGSYFDVTSDGKLLILANLNPQFNKKPDLYAVGIR